VTFVAKRKISKGSASKAGRSQYGTYKSTKMKKRKFVLSAISYVVIVFRVVKVSGSNLGKR